MAAFPYHPTRILPSSTSDDVFYISQPGVSGSASAQLLTLNTTQTLGATDLPYLTLSRDLPFLDTSQSNAYTPAVDDAENILVYTGRCEDTAQGSTLWQFTHSTEVAGINGTWDEKDLGIEAVKSSTGLIGANYLASAVAFSSTPNSTSEMYVFGGMCPTSSSSTADDWIQAANYSNKMLTIQSSQASSERRSAYSLGMSLSRGPPVAEAGFSITPLQPTFFDSATKDASQSQNQNFILLGGHTQQAFINMSQVALFSLPEQSWTFLPVDSPTPEPQTDLAARDQATVDSRSGHTALLTADGKKVVVFGGWVGDVNTSANPQLAVLQLGEGYGGSGDWQWSIPSQTGPGLTQGSGLYGHGAAMLAGDVMMVVGGYQIPASSNSKRKRANPSMGTSVYYFNTSSNSWITSYTHPAINGSHRSLKSTSVNKDEAKKVGLGLGLALGFLAVVIIVLFYFWYSRRLKRRRNAHEDDLRHLAAGTHPLDLSGRNQSGLYRRPNEMSTVDWEGDNHLLTRDNGSHSHGRIEPEAERTGLLFEIPSPTRGLRRSLHARGTYQPTSRYEDGRRGPGFSTIHPIDERDEYDEERIHGSSSGQHEMIQREDYNMMSNVPVLDPFHDPMATSRSPSPQSPQDRELEIRRWVNGWTAADALMHSQVGRISPEKTDRTSSTLSDQSARSGLSSHSIHRSVGSISRSISQRSAALLSATPFRSNNDATPIETQSNATRNNSPEHRRARSLTLYPTPLRNVNAESYTTAATSFPYLQSEGEALLGGYPAGEPSPTRSQSRTKGWMGSMRRAFTGIERSASTSPENNNSSSSSPTKRNYTDGGLPRRAASTGAMLWQKRQGARDWNVESKEGEGERRDADAPEGLDEEWDVESAVERRVVQVMFTVPKEKLRVVNRGPDGDGESMLSTEVKEQGDGDNDVKGKGKEKERE